MGRKKKESIATKQVFTVYDVAIMLDVCRATVYNLIKRRKLPVIRVDGFIRIRPKAFEAWLDQYERA